ALEVPSSAVARSTMVSVVGIEVVRKRCWRCAFAAKAVASTRQLGCAAGAGASPRALTPGSGRPHLVRMGERLKADDTHDSLLAAFAAGRRTALSRAISIVENE